MQNGREKRSSGNWQNNSQGSQGYQYLNNSGDQLNRSWSDANRGNRRGQQHQGQNFNHFSQRQPACGDSLNTNPPESFAKFRDPSQQNQQQQHNRQQQSDRRSGGGQDNNDERKHQRGGNQNRGGRKGGGGGNDGGGRNLGRRRGGGGGRNGGGRGLRSGGRGGRSGGGGRNDGDRRNGAAAGAPWYDAPMESDLFYFTNGQLNEADQATQPLPSVSPAPESEFVATPEEAVGEAARESTPVTPAAAKITTPTTLINPANIKKEKRESLSKAVSKPAESSDESSSSSSDENVEDGEVITKQSVAPVQKTKVVAKADSSSSSSDSDSSEEETPPPVKTKTAIKEATVKSAKKLKKSLSEDDVVCIGNQSNKYTIPDEDEDEESLSSSDAEGTKDILATAGNKTKTGLMCFLCDKKGHSSFECQMICRNCSGPHHSLKNCPHPPNLNIAVQAFMEFTMQQMAVFNMDKRFTFPAGIVAAAPAAVPPVAAPAASTPAKSKKEKEKRAAVAAKKSKKTPKKKIKMESKDSDEDDDDDDNEDDASDDPSSDNGSSSESSSEPQQPAAKTKRKRTSSKAAVAALPTINPAAAAAFPFSMLAAGAPYNSMMYPYAAPFNFPK